MHTDSVTPSPLNCSLVGSRLNEYLCFSDTKASALRRSITHRGCARASSNLRPICGAHGSTIQWCSRRRGVHQRYTEKTTGLTDRFSSRYVGGAGGNRTHV